LRRGASISHGNARGQGRRTFEPHVVQVTLKMKKLDIAALERAARS
jgi:hypothetical protein